MSNKAKIAAAVTLFAVCLIYVLLSRANFSATGYDDEAEDSSSDLNRPKRDPSELSRVRYRFDDKDTLQRHHSEQQREAKEDQRRKQQEQRDAAAPSSAAVVSPISTKEQLENPCDDNFDPTTDTYNVPPPCILRPPAQLPKNANEARKTHLHRYSLVNFLRLHRNASLDTLQDANYPVICILTLLHTTVCREFEESFVGCARRIGVSNLAKILPGRCIESGFFKSFAQELNDAKKHSPELFPKEEEPSPDLWKSLPRGTIPDSTMWPEGAQRDYVPPEKRTVAQFGPPAKCGDGTEVYPFGFGIPLANIATRFPRYKVFDFMPIVPPRHLGPRGWGIRIAEEQLFREFYSASYFAFSNRRGGVDCLRHYEILASGTVLHMPELNVLGRHRVTHLPREHMREAMQLPGVRHVGEAVGNFEKRFRDEGHQPSFFSRISHEHIHFNRPGTILPHDGFSTTAYTDRARAMLNFTQHHLSTGQIVASMLKTMNNENPKKVLLVTRFEYDYMQLTLHSGFSELGIPVTIVGENPSAYFYRQRADKREQTEFERGERLFRRAGKLYGGGFGFAGRGLTEGKDEFIPDRNNKQLIKRILDKEFDLVVYCYIYPHGHHEMPYMGEVPAALQRNQIAFVDHNDWDSGDKTQMFKWLSKRGFVFSREMPDKACV